MQDSSLDMRKVTVPKAAALVFFDRRTASWSICNGARAMTDGPTAAPTRPASETTELSYESTVSRHFVHRSAVAEVLLTDWRPTGGDTFVCAAQWPRGHTLRSVNDGDFDPLLVAETIRQCGILLAHVGYAVPLGDAFLMQRLRFACSPELMRPVGGRPLDLVVEVKVSEIQRRGRRISGMRIDTLLRTSDAQIAEGSGWLRCVNPAVYRRLRRVAVPQSPELQPVVPPMAPALVGRNGVGDVVIGTGDGERGYRLRVPMDHPLFFDHAVDHVPGMLAIEALRQAAVAVISLPGAGLVAVDAQFDGFLEFDRACTVVPRVLADQHGRWDVLVDIEQDQRSVVRGSVSLTS